ncbi:MAG: hypothetical protein C0405_11655, partial [Desulfovibrio sp.]|nr:hypothetical protein [Desulfovibrio sp.]
MKSFFSWSIRTHLLVLVLAATVPAMTLVWWGGQELQRLSVEKAQQATQHLVQCMAEDLEQVEENARVLLTTLAQVPSIRKLDQKTSTKLLTKLHKLHPSYANLSLITLDARVLALSIPFSGVVDVSKRKYYQDVLRTREFSVGEYAISYTTKRPVLHFAHPVFGESGELVGVLGATYDITSLAQAFNAAGLPEGSAMALSDSRGVRLFRYPDPDKWMGQQEPPALWERMLSMGEEGVGVGAGADGVRRLYAMKRLRRHPDDPSFLLARVGI